MLQSCDEFAWGVDAAVVHGGTAGAACRLVLMSNSALMRLAACPPDELAIAPAEAPYPLPDARVSVPPSREEEPTGWLARGPSPYQAFVDARIRELRGKRVARQPKCVKNAGKTPRGKWVSAIDVVAENVAWTLGTGNRIDGMHPGSWNRGCRCVDCLRGQAMRSV